MLDKIKESFHVMRFIILFFIGQFFTRTRHTTNLELFFFLRLYIYSQILSSSHSSLFPVHSRAPASLLNILIFLSFRNRNNFD